MAANDPSRQHKGANHGDAEFGDAEFPGQRNFVSTRPHRRFRRLRPEGAHAPSHTLKERSNRCLMNPTWSEGFQSSSLQDQVFQHTISTHQMIDLHAQTVDIQVLPVRTSALAWPAFVVGPTVLLFATRLALDSRNFAGRLLETLGHRHICGSSIKVVWALIIDLRETPCVTGHCVNIT